MMAGRVLVRRVFRIIAGVMMSLIAKASIEKLWISVLSKLEYGRLEFTAPNGEQQVFVGRHDGPHAKMILNDWNVITHVAARGDIGFGEDYVAGGWDTDDIEALAAFFMVNNQAFNAYARGNPLNRLMLMLHNRLIRRNSVNGSRKNIEAHYDVGNDFYALWLDKTMTYSSAIFGRADASLEDAQRNKYDRILGKFTRPNASVLEIGCGWGGFAERAAEFGHRVTGLTVSPSQFRFATDRLRGAADILLEDYRKARGLFDNIVSIEMFEAVGEEYWPRYFHAVAERLKRGGRAVVQTITIRDDLFADYRMRSDFIRHSVFPGGMLPSVQRFCDEAERAGLKVADQFAFGLDYVKTLREWSVRMREKSADIIAMGHDEKFLRNWQYYLGICAAAFSTKRTNVVQVELVNA